MIAPSLRTPIVVYLPFVRALSGELLGALDVLGATTGGLFAQLLGNCFVEHLRDGLALAEQELEAAVGPPSN